MEKRVTGKKILAVLLSLIMTVGLMPVTAFADNEGPTAITQVTVVNFETPYDGATAGHQSRLEVYDSSHCTISREAGKSFWKNAEGLLGNDAVFEAGATYQEGAVLVADEGYYFADNCTFTVENARGSSIACDTTSTKVDSVDKTRAYVWAVEQSAADTYPVWVGNVQVTNDNKDNILNAEYQGRATASYDPATSSLTLNNPQITSYYQTPDERDYAVIYSDGIDLTIDVQNGLTVNGEGVEHAIFAQNGKLTINGNIKAKAKQYGLRGYKGVCINGSIDVESKEYSAVSADNGDIDIKGNIIKSVTTYADNARPFDAVHGDINLTGKVTAIGGGEHGIFAQNGAINIKGDVKASAKRVAVSGNTGVKIKGSVDAEATDAEQSGCYAISSYNGDIEIEGTTIKASANSTDGRAIYSELKAVKLTGDVTATAGKYAIYSYVGDLTIKGDVTAEAKEIALYSYGNIKIEGSVDAKAGEDFYQDATIYAAGGIEIEGDTVKAVNKAVPSGKAIYADNGDLKLSGDVTAESKGKYAVHAKQGKVILSSGRLEAETEDGDRAIYASAGIEYPDTHKILIPAGGKVVHLTEGGDSYTVTGQDGVTMAKNVVIAPVMFTVKFNANGGTVSTESMMTGTNGKLRSLPTPEREGYDFLGWFDASGKKVSKDTVFTEDTTVYAMWKKAEPVIDDDFPFIDVPKSSWSYPDIRYVWKNGLMKGISDIRFGPQLATSRAMIVTILHRLEGEPVVNYAMTFSDVESGKWYTEAIRWAQANKIVNGYDSESFGPDDMITREQMAAILYRYAGFKGCNVSAKADLSKFTDIEKAGDWAKDSLAWANATGLVNGVSDKVLDPCGQATREQVAAILHRFCDKVYDEIA